MVIELTPADGPSMAKETGSPTSRGQLQDQAYWEGLVKRSLCRFLLLSQLARGPVHGYGLNRAIQEACQGCCQPTEAMVYSTMKELIDGGYLEWRMEHQGGRKRRVCWLTPTGEESLRAAAGVWQKMLPKIEESVVQALSLGAHGQQDGQQQEI